MGSHGYVVYTETLIMDVFQHLKSKLCFFKKNDFKCKKLFFKDFPFHIFCNFPISETVRDRAKRSEIWDHMSM